MHVSKVLVVDSDGAARDALVTCLKFVGMEAHGAEDAAAAHCWLKTDVADVVERVESLIEDRKLRHDAVLEFGELSLDIESGWVSCGERRIALAQAEARLLAFFFGLPDKVFSRAQLLQRLWPSNVRIAERTVDVHIRRLRRALAHLDCAEYVQTVRCSGYRFSTF